MILLYMSIVFNRCLIQLTMAWTILNLKFSALTCLVQNTFEDLEDSGCIKMNEDNVEPTMLGSIASQYYLSYMTVSMFGSNIGSDTSLEVVLHILSAASEYNAVPVRHNKYMMMRRKNEGRSEVPNYDIENQHNPLETSMSQELANLSPLPPLRCIYRVPERLRCGNENAYTPRVVSIGPLHHGKEHLKAMEEHKKRYLADFLYRTQVSLNDYINKIKDQEARLRSYYAEFIEFDSDEFVKIVLVDAAFIIEFLLRRCFPQFRDENDYIFEKPWMKYDISPDLRMLENQLPFFILEDLFDPDKLFPPASRQFSLIFVSLYSFRTKIYREGTKDDLDRIFVPGVEVKHFVDFMRILCQPMEPKTGGKLKSATIPNMAELHQAGVKFKVGTSKSLFDIKFSSGVLEIPKLRVEDWTELVFRNLLAFEQCHCKNMDYITNYVFLMKRLASSSKDVELLVEHGIVENWIGENSGVSTLLNNLGSGVMVSNHYYATLCDELNNYCRTRRHKWMANLRQNYFNTPWSTVSVIAASVLLILTLIQTVCSVISII